MPPSAKVKAAFQAMKSIGIPENKTKPALKKLLKLFDKNWDLIEEENYRVLADTIFEYEETEAAEKEEKKTSTVNDQRDPLEEESQMQEEQERPLKRLRLKHQNQSGPSSGIALKIPKPEPGEPADLPSQPQAVVRDKGKQPISSENAGLAVERPPSSAPLRIREPITEKDETGKHKQLDTEALVNSKDETIPDDSMSLKPLAIVPPANKQDDQRPGISKSVEGIDKTTVENHVKGARAPVSTPPSVQMAASPQGRVTICMNFKPGPHLLDFHLPDMRGVLKKMDDYCIKTYNVMNPKFSVRRVMKELCKIVWEVGTIPEGSMLERSCLEDSTAVINKGTFCISSSMNGSAHVESTDTVAASMAIVVSDASKPHSVSAFQLDDRIGCVYDMSDITKGQERIKISLAKSNCEFLPSFQYIVQNVVSHNADVNFSLAQIGELDCCISCQGDCLSVSSPCNCIHRNEGEAPYTKDGLVREDFLEECISMVRNPKHYLTYCKECPLERLKNDDMLDPCKGHLKRKFIKECWTKCGCTRYCGNRVVQRGIRCNLQVFWTPEGKGWGLRSLDGLPKGAFVCEYVGEILTNTELHERNTRQSNAKHAYSVVLDTDWGTRVLKEEEVLCLDATFYGNVARFINHRCADANLIEIPVELETCNHHYYHVALFTSRKIEAFEELTWDYGVDFDDNEQHNKAFRCLCGSEFCRNMKRSSRSRSALALQ